MRAWAVILLALWVGGCAPVGVRGMARDRPAYAEVISQTWKDQLLANVVRSGYRDAPMYLQVGSVVTQYRIGAGVSAEPILQIEGTGGNEVGLGAGVEVEERPTVTYFPLTGEDFASRLLRPIGVESMVLLIDSGLPFEQTFVLCVESAGGVPADRLRELAGVLRSLREAGRWSAHETVTEGDRQRITVRGAGGSVEELLAGGAGSAGAMASGEVEVWIRTRSLSGMMSAAGRGIGEGGGAWGGWPWPAIRVGEDPPGDAFVRCRYEGRWYWVERSDVESRVFFTVATQLFSLQAFEVGGRSPVLTLPAGE